MDKKAISEIRKLIKPDSSIDRIRGCYVNEEGKVIRQLQDSLATMEEDSQEKYCEILRGAMSGKLGRNLFNMGFPLEEEMEGGRYQMLYRLQQSELRDDDILTEFYEKVVEKFRIEGKYLILLIHGVYDIPAKGSDNMDMDDASDYVYSFIVCCICPVSLMKEGLCYDEEACTFLDRRRDWAVQKPVSGFLFPAFNDRMPDIHSLLYYCRKEDERHEEISADLLGCTLPMPESDQKEVFRSMVEQTLGSNCDFENVKNIHDAVGEMIEQNKDAGEPVQIEKAQMRRLLYENGADQSVLSDFDAAYDEAVGEGVPLMAENLVDTSRFEVKSPSLKISVKSDMSDMLKTKVIDGMEYLLIPVTDELEVNGIRIRQRQK
ncbi:MAG: DUF4317 domain-containing protein [Lachnospiraceae bacterium]|jgi:hypothetical protein|nr:DUF4317 domain-containing protein [Lachnospiraceae bacterium]